MKKLVFVIFLILIIFIIFTTFQPQFYKPKVITYSNVTELYSLFTTYMNEEVDYRLRIIDCVPNEYFYENTAFCFVCEGVDACFGYTWVDRAEGKRMNPLGIPYLKFKSFDVKVADFYYDGLASDFNCRKTNKKLDCSYGVSFLLENGEVSMLVERTNFEKVAETVCEKMRGLENFTCEENICYCDNVYVGFANGEIKYGYYEYE